MCISPLFFHPLQYGLIAMLTPADMSKFKKKPEEDEPDSATIAADQYEKERAELARKGPSLITMMPPIPVGGAKVRAVWHCGGFLFACSSMRFFCDC